MAVKLSLIDLIKTAILSIMVIYRGYVKTRRGSEYKKLWHKIAF